VTYMKNGKVVPDSIVDDLFYEEYGSYIMENSDPSEVVICNGDSLLEYMEKGYLWDEFLESVGIVEVDE
jgi:hypothetical protein